MSRAIPDDPPFALVPLLEVERDRLLELLRSLEAPDWDRPTRCTGWSVLDLAAHLLGDDLGYVARHRDGHHGTDAPALVDEGAFIDWIDAVQDEWVRASRRLSPTLVLDLLAWTGPQVVDAVASEDPTERAASVSWASARPVPRWLDHARELTERWIHRQQLLDALGRPVDLRPDLAEPVLDTLRRAYPFRLTAHPRPHGAVVEVVVHGREGERSWRFVSDGEAWDAAPSGTAGAGGSDTPDVLATISMTDDHAWRLLTNNLEVAVHGRPSTSGESELVATLLATRAIIGRPNEVG